MRSALLLLLLGGLLVGGCGGAGSEELDGQGRDSTPGDSGSPDQLPDGSQDAFDVKPQGDLPGDGQQALDGQSQADGDLLLNPDLLPDPDLYPVLCQPCRTDADCEVEGGPGERCLTYGDAGSYCGTLCADADACPKGFSCEPRQDGEGVETKQCVALGQCHCNAASINEELYTFCYAANDFGRCKGARFCKAMGLTDCNAKEPEVELCNGLDDDCDGFTDEEGPELVKFCNDLESCTLDGCAEGECLHVPLDGPTCADGNECTRDHCEGGLCVGVADDTLPCGVTEPCHLDPHCSAGECLFTEKNCDDGEICTRDICESDGTCSNTQEYWKLGCEGCVSNSFCHDDDPCTKDICDRKQIVPKCVNSPVDCDDGSPCTADSCDSEGSLLNPCVHTLTPQAPGCEAEDLCVTGTDCPPPLSCQEVTCVRNSGDALGLCKVADKLCNDFNPCTKDSCNPSSGLCEYATLKCADENPCTRDYCDPGLGCIHEATTGKCSDTNACTEGDQCQDGGCRAGAPVVCDDKNPCTADYCDPAKGCTYLPVALPCDDLDPCTLGDTCSQGNCVGGSPRVCDDQNPCTNDECVQGVGCASVPAGNACSDGDPCTAGDRCEGGLCLAGSPRSCNDNNSCTDDACDSSLGCLHQNNSDLCDDGNKCTTGDRCSAGWCLAATVKDCSDGIVCTTDSCDPKVGCKNLFLMNPCTDLNPCTDDMCDTVSGCIFLSNTKACEDGDKCTTGDKCAAGRCLPGTTVNCDDGSPCTEDSCEAAKGCVYDKQLPCCPNGLTEAGEDCDDFNLLAGDGCSPTCFKEWASCQALLTAHPGTPSGEHYIDPDGVGPAPGVKVWCDMTSEGGGWTRVLWDDGSSGAGWSNTEVTANDDGSIHGIWGQSPAEVWRSVDLLGLPHTQLRVAAVYYAIDSWDSELGRFYVDAGLSWEKIRPYHSGCQDWTAYASGPAPWGGIRCKAAFSVVVSHANPTAELKFGTTINQDEGDEAWGFDNVEVFVR